MSNCSFCRSGTLTNNRRSTTDSRKNSWRPFCCGSYRDSMPYICRRSWSLRSRTNRFWKSRHSPDWSCRRCTCRSCWCWRSRTNRISRLRHNPGFRLRSGICSDSPTTILNSRTDAKRRFGCGSCRCRLFRICWSNRYSIFYSRKEC